MDFSDLIVRNASFSPDKPALRFQGEVWSYAALATRIEVFARALKSQIGVRGGDRVAILALNHPDYLALLGACARLGAMLVPLNWRLAVPELLFILRDAEVSALFFATEFDAVCEPLLSVMPDVRLIGLDHVPHRGVELETLIRAGSGDGRQPNVNWDAPALLIYTAGTTGRPKGAVLTQGALLANGIMSQHMHDMTSADHVLTVLPFFHVGGLNIQTTPALQIGATVTIHPRFVPSHALHALHREAPTLTVLVPATIQALLEHPQWMSTDVSSLRAMTTGSTMVPQGLIDAVTARGVPVLQVYGATETSPIAIYTRLGGDFCGAGSVGRPGLLCEACVADAEGAAVPDGVAGEILVRGPNVLVAYWRNQTATAEALRDGWFSTGDIAVRDEKGCYTIYDRKKNLIKSGGENIYPAEIERVLLDHPEVLEAAVIGVADPVWQEVPKAYVVARAGAQLSIDALRTYLRQQLARFKIPRDIVFITALPRNALGKVQHFRLQQGWDEPGC